MPPVNNSNRDKGVPPIMASTKNPKKPKVPKFVNRGPAGLLRKLPKGHKKEEDYANPKVDYDGSLKDNIAEPIAHLAVEISSLTPDPMNARIHPERNMEAIRQSLALYGQLKPIVVRKEGMIVIAGNGTLQAAMELGWTKLAASIIDISHIDATGYGLADNRTSELARWNGDVLPRIAKLLAEQKAVAVGYSSDELQVLRTAEDLWEPPAIEDGDAHPTSPATRVLKFTQEQYEAIDRAVDAFKRRETKMNGKIEKWSDEDCLVYILKDWLGDRKTIRVEDTEEGEVTELSLFSDEEEE